MSLRVREGVSFTLLTKFTDNII